MDVLRLVHVSQDNLLGAGILIDQYVKAKVVVEVDGKPASGDYLHLFDDWSLEDVNFYSAVYNELFGDTQAIQEKARETARFLRASLTSTAGQQ